MVHEFDRACCAPKQDRPSVYAVFLAHIFAAERYQSHLRDNIRLLTSQVLRPEQKNDETINDRMIVSLGKNSSNTKSRRDVPEKLNGAVGPPGEPRPAGYEGVLLTLEVAADITQTAGTPV
jgi:hypothetical protein